MNITLVERTKKYLFAPVSDMEADKIPSATIQRIVRIRSMYAYWLQYPNLSEKKIVSLLRTEYNIGPTVAYEDAMIIKMCLGDMSKLTREYYEYYFMQRCEEGFQMARDRKDVAAFSRVLSAFIKGTQLDKETRETPDYSTINPEQIVMSDNPSVAGFVASPEILKKAKALEEKYIREATIAEAELIEDEDLTPIPIDIRSHEQQPNE